MIPILEEHYLLEEKILTILGILWFVWLTLCVNVVSYRDDHMDQITHLFPNSSVEHILGAGHWVHFEKPQQFIYLVRKFLTDSK